MTAHYVLVAVLWFVVEGIAVDSGAVARLFSTVVDRGLRRRGSEASEA
jgi:hypothetical protein